jgi:hypothetical protein
MLDPRRISPVQKTARQPWQQIQTLIGLAQQECSAVGTDRAPVESGHDLPSPEGFKSETRLVTLCHSEGRSFFGVTACWETQLCHEGRPFANSW